MLVRHRQTRAKQRHHLGPAETKNLEDRPPTLLRGAQTRSPATSFTDELLVAHRTKSDFIPKTWVFLRRNFSL